jgi:HEAT repeat protein
MIGLLLALPWLLWAAYALLAILRHEHFFHGLPSSYWAERVHRWPAPEPMWLDGAPTQAITVADYLGLRGKEPVVLTGGPGAVGVLCDLLHSPDPHVRREAARAVGALGEEGSAATAALLQVLAQDADEDEGRRQTPTGLIARDALSALGETAIPAVVEALSGDPDRHIRRQAARALASQGSLPQSTLPALAVALRDVDARVREHATRALLGVAGWEDSHGPEVLTVAITDDDPDVRAVAWHAVSRRALPANAANLALLTEALHAAAPSTRCGAAHALARMGRPASGANGAGAISALKSALKDPDESVRDAAAEAVRRIVPTGASLNDPVRTEAAP